MKITLDLEDGKKEFTMGRPKARVVQKAIKLATNLDPKNVDEETLDELIGITIMAYENQFTVDDIYDGLYYDEIMPILQDNIHHIVNGTQGKLNQPKNV